MEFKTRYQYDPQSPIGIGGFSRVYKAWDAVLERDVAIKIFSSMRNGKGNVIDEIRKAVKLQHPNLLWYYDVVELENINVLGEKESVQIAIIEYANKGDLKNFIADGSSKELIPKFLVETLKGLSYLHKKGIIHRDLKPQNILISEADGELTAKIADFGISKDISSSSTQSSAILGTIEYMAPEQFNPAKYGIDGKIGTNIDLWSFGLMVYQLFTGDNLFGAQVTGLTSEQVMSNILQKEVHDDLLELPEPWRSVVASCVIRSAADRARSADELIEILNRKSEEGENKPRGNTVVGIQNSTIRKGVEEAVTVVMTKPKQPQLTPPKKPTIITPHQTIDPNADIKSDKNFWKKNKFPICIGAILLLALAVTIWFSSGGSTKTYAEAKIGHQIWMAANLDVANFSNGDEIFQALSSEEWETALVDKNPCWCYADFKSNDVRGVGKFYNWYAIHDDRGIAPEGWHVASEEEWYAMDEQLSRDDYHVIGNGWTSGDPENELLSSTDQLGFNALPVGMIYNGGYLPSTSVAAWWTSTDSSAFVVNTSDGLNRYSYYHYEDEELESGLPVRCIKD